MTSPFIPCSFTYGDAPNGGSVMPTVIAARQPSNTIDKNFPSGYLWLSSLDQYYLNSSNQRVYGDGSLWYQGGNSSGVPNWTIISDGSSIVSVLGTANQITVTNVAGVVTLSIPATFIAPGSIASTTTIAAGTSLSAATTITAGTGLTVTTGGILVSGGDIINSHSDAGTDVTIEVTNSDNTNAASRSGVEIATGGASSGDPYLSFQISGVGASTMTMGLDNSASDLFVISNSTAIGTSNALTLSQAGALTATTSLTATLGDITATNGNIVRGTAGNKDVYSSVATDGTAGANSAGTATLAGGIITINTTAVTASSQIRLYRQGIGATGAAALGILTLGTVTAGASFVINAVQAANATALQASDVSVIAWEIVN